MDWEEYEHVVPRDAKRRAPPEGIEPDRTYRDRIRKTVLDHMYPRRKVDRDWFDQEAEFIPSYVAGRLRLSVADVRRAMQELVEAGFLRGPVRLPKRHYDGSPSQYDIESGTSMSSPALTVEWAGTRWVEAVHQWGSWRIIRRKDGRVWRNPPKKLVERALRKAMAARRPVEFDGMGFETLCAGRPFRDYGIENKLFEEPPEREKRRDPQPEICRRCGTEVKYKFRSGKRRRNHGLNKCNMAMVRKIMED